MKFTDELNKLVESHYEYIVNNLKSTIYLYMKSQSLKAEIIDIRRENSTVVLGISCKGGVYQSTLYPTTLSPYELAKIADEIIKYED